MTHKNQNNRGFRGLLQSKDGVITKVFQSNKRSITFQTAFGLSERLIYQLRKNPEHLVFSERSRIARMGIQVSCEPPRAEDMVGDSVYLNLEAAPMIPGYPGLDDLKEFFTVGFPVGRLIFCNPQALLTSDQVLEAIESAELKLPASTTISSDGSILIAPHKVACHLKEPLDKEALCRILLREDGREILNRFQERRALSVLTIPPGEGVVTTCSMYLNEHYVVLQSGYELGRHLPATILDPIKTRGIRIYLEIVNGSTHPIVNPLISAKIYRAPRTRTRERRKTFVLGSPRYSYEEMRRFEKRFPGNDASNCSFLCRPAAVVRKSGNGLETARMFLNGPKQPCGVTRSGCVLARRDFSAKSPCPHVYATSKMKRVLKKRPVNLAMKYFPNILEHRDIINFASDGLLEALYFYEPSYEHGPFLSQLDHNRLQEYNVFGLDVYWICGLNNRLMVHTIRDGMGYFVVPERLADFHKSMLFAFYGSNQPLSDRGIERMCRLMEALIGFWGKNIGIVTGGGSGVMEQANTLARERGILSGANFLEITDQSMTTDVDFCQVFQATCRHSRQKWFEVTSFPIFNVGGLGSLEELGITLCNMKLSILEPVPVILFDTEGNGEFWKGIENQIRDMVASHRAPPWIVDNLVITGDPQAVVDAYRQRLQLF